VAAREFEANPGATGSGARAVRVADAGCPACGLLTQHRLQFPTGFT